MPGLLVGVRRKQGAVCLCSLLIYRPFILLILIVQQNIKKVNWQEQRKRIENWRTKLDSVIRFKYSVSLVALLEVISRGSCVGRFQIIFSCLFFVLISNISPHFCCGLSPFSVLVWKKIFLDTCDGLFFLSGGVLWKDLRRGALEVPFMLLILFSGSHGTNTPSSQISCYQDILCVLV